MVIGHLPQGAHAAMVRAVYERNDTLKPINTDILGFLQLGFYRLPDHTPSVMWMGWQSVFCEAAGFLQIPYGRLF
jgi:hypothetical protein